MSSIIFVSPSAWSLIEGTVNSTIQSYIKAKKKCEVTGREDEAFWKVFSADTKVHQFRHTDIKFILDPNFLSKVDYKIYGSKFGCGLGEKGSIVVSPGRTESSPEYYETAIDFINAGYSPVYVIDHVGQGLSPRLLNDPNKGHIHYFRDYINGMKALIDQFILPDLQKVEKRTTEPLFYTSNSMGGAIGIGFLQQYNDENPFRAAALLGPMIRINFLGFPDGIVPEEDAPNGVECPTKLQYLKGKESSVKANARYQQTEFGYGSYATKKARANEATYGTAYIMGGRNFTEAFAKAPEQVMTHSQDRYDLKTFLWESSFMHDLYEEMGLTGNWNGSKGPTMSAPTMQWTLQGANYNQMMRTGYNIRKMKTPIKIITGSHDVRAYKPYENCSHDLSYHSDFCDKVNEENGAGSCEFYELTGSYHEIYKESDNYRNEGFKQVLDFFEPYTK